MSDPITELEAMVTAEEPEPAPDDTPLRNSEIAYNLAVIILDLMTGWIIGSITIWYYGVIWFLAGAIAFFLHSNNWEREGNNEYQEKNAKVGMIVAVASVFLMAVIAGGIYLTKWKSPYIMVGIEASTITLFFWNAFQVAMYRFNDDVWKMNRQIAQARANANKKVAFIKAAGTVVAANKKAIGERNNQYNKHGDRGAVDAAISQFDKQKGQQMRPAYAETTEKPELKDKEKDFTNGGRKQ
jgi:hypothetical protein